MARSTMSRDQARAEALERAQKLVFPLCEELASGGQRPQASTVRALLMERRGEAINHNHIQRAVDAWRDKQAQAEQQDPLPPDLARSFHEWRERERAAAREELRLQIATLTAEKADLLTTCNLRDEQIETLTGRVAELTAERERLNGQATQLTTDLERQAQELRTVRHEAEEARSQLSSVRQTAATQAATLDELRQERDRLVGELRQDREGRRIAELSLVSSEAALSALRDHNQQLQKAHEASLTERQELQSQLAHAQEARGSAERALGTAQAEAKGAIARVGELTAREREQQDEIKRLGEKIDRLYAAASSRNAGEAQAAQSS